ncbi:MAG: glycosyltransferase [Ekhidna sp.]|uniref:glycosyltransferase n=1 Tax=Ekhidna sp. TaxID=2608089 RepID=UPI0032EE78EC
MNQLPLVSVVCLCHNQERFVQESIKSVWSQSYPNIELIVVDDGSSDGSKELIHSILDGKNVKFISLETTLGNCQAFNLGFRESRGEYIIDLAADDILMPERVLCGINTFMKSDAGVSFCDVLNIDENGKELGTHFKRDKKGTLFCQVPEGDIYANLIKKYFISPPSMMIKREVLEELNGYDESLSYEDFDFWIRSSRNWKYAFTNEVLVKKRKVAGSLSDQQFRRKSTHQKSTLRVCQKIKKLNRTREERSALRIRCLYEIRQCLRQRNFKLIPGFLRLL